MYNLFALLGRMTKKTMRYPCDTATSNCDCISPICWHDCCAARRDRLRMSQLATLTKAREMMTANSPSWKATTQEMVNRGHTTGANLLNDFNDNAEAPNASTEALVEGFRQQREGSEQEAELTRITARILPLSTPNDAAAAMTFYYTAQTYAQEGDSMALPFKIAFAACAVTRFTGIMRAAARDRAGWNKGCTEVMNSIDRHFMTTAKSAIDRGMVMAAREDPSLYADRILNMLDVYGYFATIVGKGVDEEALARAWTNGLPEKVRLHVAVHIGQAANPTIRDALGVARLAYTPSAPHRAATPLASMIGTEDTGGDEAGPVDTAIPAAHLTMLEAVATAVTSLSAMVPANTAALAALAAATAPAKEPTCPMRECKGALHRFPVCPNRIVCTNCDRWGHHTIDCRRPRKTSRPAGDSDKQRTRDRDRDHERDRDDKKARTDTGRKGRETSPRRPRSTASPRRR